MFLGKSIEEREYDVFWILKKEELRLLWPSNVYEIVIIRETWDTLFRGSDLLMHCFIQLCEL